MIENQNYYVDLINSSKANKFTAYYHYSGVGFKKAQVNIGVYRKTDNLLVGVLQWGVSAQEKIRLDRYVKEPITKEQYLELNRFCMADSEGKNAESQAISLGIKWIKQNRPDIKLLVSYAGRKEGNYGYIYQATSWEYLGYFLSDGFWFVDGEERHLITLWSRYKKHGDTNKPFRQALCDMYHDVRETTTKQFIYIKRLDKKLTVASPVLSYPKPDNEYPICTEVKVLQEDPEYINHWQKPQMELPIYYYEKEHNLFSRRALKRRGEYNEKWVAAYDKVGELVCTKKTLTEMAAELGISIASISLALKDDKMTHDYKFKYFFENDGPLSSIPYEYFCEIDGIVFFKQKEVAAYLGIAPQAVSYAYKKQAKKLHNKEVKWYNKE